MKLSDFDFELPNELIALRPAVPRTAARLLVSQSGQRSHDQFDNIAHYLRPGDRLVLNDTKVIPSHLSGQRIRQSDMGETRAQIGVNLLSLNAQGNWLALAKPAKRVNVGETIEFSADLRAQVLEKSPQGLVLEFNQQGADFDAALLACGNMPLPPYIAAQRAVDQQDAQDYQTVFARRTGAVAAPTASLHFDQPLLDNLAAMGVQQTKVTLHVGAGTFLPVKVDDIQDHKMHAEWGEVSASAAAEIAQTKADGGRIIPVGTTALRLIETAAQGGGIKPWVGDTDIFITPGFEFQITSGLITNFHLPKSTLLMLVAALIGTDQLRSNYQSAINRGYRFFSYGDSSLLIP
ncbi:tRNA preQ1(34) S-adenosylmethionine ribosyltransferase-isomerase QueA [Amylibacter marinus]|nr:tRNA preQ1(34) S-adenosylmethionine ribosyltransferase-isomerase QueA [Amylibacter marinus]